jgi:signal transduction histidine kinase
MSTESTHAETISATLGLVQPNGPSQTRGGSRYGRLWRLVPRELGFLSLTMPIAIIGLGILSGVFFSGVGTVLIYIGLLLILAALYIARGFGTVELVRLRWAGRPAIRAPRWREAGARRGFWRSMFGPYGNGHYWLYLLHGMIVNPIVSIFSWAVTVGWVATGLGGVTYWLWNLYLPNDGRRFFLSSTIFGALFPRSEMTFNPVFWDAVVQFALGAIFLITLPLITHGLTLLHHVIGLGLLGSWRADALQEQVADLSESRGAAIAAEDQSLRRLERDIHDGPQQRLVRLQMDLASAGRALERDPDAARALIEEASAQARDALEELRALSRGFAPPILQDRGLVAGIESLVARSTVPTTLETTLDPESRFVPEIERSAYFMAAELLANVAKHSGAAAARLSAAQQHDESTGKPWLIIVVSDNGRGGAVVVPGHGLGGMQERVRGLRGSIRIDSPQGGPTSIVVSLPV